MREETLALANRRESGEAIRDALAAFADVSSSRAVTNPTRIVGPRHLNLVLRGFARHYNSRRPHQGIDLQAPETIGVIPTPVPIDEIRRRRVVGGLISEYHARAA